MVCSSGIRSRMSTCRRSLAVAQSRRLGDSRPIHPSFVLQSNLHTLYTWYAASPDFALGFGGISGRWDRHLARTINRSTTLEAHFHRLAGRNLHAQLHHLVAAARQSNSPQPADRGSGKCAAGPGRGWRHLGCASWSAPRVTIPQALENVTQLLESDGWTIVDTTFFGPGTVLISAQRGAYSLEVIYEPEAPRPYWSTGAYMAAYVRRAKARTFDQVGTETYIAQAIRVRIQGGPTNSRLSPHR